MSMQLIHFLGTVVTAEYEKLEKDNKVTAVYVHHRIAESKSTDSTSDSQVSQTNSCIPSVPCLQQDTTYNRPKYSDDQQRKVIEIYDSFPCKLTAMKAINQIHGFESIYKRKIERWKLSSKPMGRPVSREFENEVITEYAEYWKKNCINKNSNSSSTSSYYSFCTSGAKPYISNSVLKKCALAVFDRDYWDEKSNSYIKKWHIDKLTSKLCFSNRWITGLLMRSNKSIPEGSVQHSDCRSASAVCRELVSCNSAEVV